ncbi:MAG: hypothetical protein ACRDRO_14355 [Pseudonocardiaceae bacterium]
MDTLPLQRRLRHERIPRNELLWAFALVVGLAGFLLVATAGFPAIHENADRGPAIAAGLLTVGAAAVCVLGARATAAGFHLIEVPAGPLTDRFALVQQTVEQLRR